MQKANTKIMKSSYLRWSLMVALVVGLELAVAGGLIRPVTLAAPSQVVATLAGLVLRGELFSHFFRTMTEMLVSFALAALLGVPLGLLLWRVAILGRITEPYLVSLYAVPLILFYPLMLALFGLGPLPIILVAGAMGFIPIVVNTTIGFTQIKTVFHKVALSMNCTWGQRYRKVLFPAAAPSILTGLKLGFIYCLIGTVAMEFVTANAGIGFSVYYYYHAFQSRPMYAYILTIILVAALANYLLNRLEGRIRREMT